MKKVLLLSSVVFCAVSAMAQVPSQQQPIISSASLLPVHVGDAFSVRLNDIPQLKVSSLLKNGIRTAGIAAAAYQTEKLVEGSGRQ